MKEKKSLEMYFNMPVSKAVIQNIIPAILAMAMVLIYNLADTFFIGQTHDAYQVAAVSLATPVFLIFMAIGNIFGIGGTSVISRAMGQGNKGYAKKVCAFCMWSCIILGIAISALFLIYMDQILIIVGASDSTFEFTKTYMSIVCYCGPFAIISSCFSNILRSEGEAGKAMLGQIIGNLLNMTLDAVLIMGFNLNIAGAAWATFFGEVVGAVYYLSYYLRKKSSLSINIKDVTLKEEVCSSVLIIGIPAACGSILMSISQIIMNSLMAVHGDMALAGIGVAMKVTMITGMICMGVGQGVQPLLGYAVGAKALDKFKKIMRFSMIISIAIACVMTVLCYLFINQIAGVFLSDKNAFNYAVEFSKILLSTSALFGVFYVLVNALQAMGAAMPSLIISMSRQGIIYIPALFILNMMLGADGLAWAQPLADVLSIGLAIIFYRKSVMKIIK